MAFGIFIKFFLPDILNDRLQRKLNNTFHDYYNIDYEQIETKLGFDGFQLLISSPVFTSDTADQEKKGIFPTFFFEADRLEINQLPIWDLLFSENIDAGSVTLQSPQLTVLTNSANDTVTRSMLKQNVDEPIIKNLGIGSLKIHDGQVTLAPLIAPIDSLFSGAGIELTLSGFNAKPEKLKDAEYMTETFRNVKVKSKGAFYNPPDAEYSFLMEGLEADFKEQRLVFYEAAMQPKGSIYAVGDESRYRKTIADIVFEEMKFSRLDYKSILIGKNLHADKVDITSADFKLLRNNKKNYNVNQPAPLIPEYVNMLGKATSIDTLEFKETEITLDIITPHREHYSQLVISDVNAMAINVGHSSLRTEEMYLKLEGSMMGVASMELEAWFPANEPEKSKYAGRIGKMKFSVWNDIIGQFMNVSVDSGSLDYITFDGTTTKYTTTGKLTTSYQNLKFNLFSLDDQGKKQKKFLTAITNWLVKDAQTYEGEEAIDYQFTRQPYQGQVLLWLGGVMDGLKVAILGKEIGGLIKPEGLGQ